MNYHHLRIFYEVARRGNLTAAARSLRVAQSAVSVQVRSLEEALGEKLFHRDRKGLVLTEAGRLVEEYCSRIFSLGEELRATLRGISQGRPLLRVGAIATLSRNFQIALLSPLLSRVTLVLQTGPFRSLLSELVEHRLDIVLCNHALTSANEGVFDNHLLAEQEACIVVASTAEKKRSFRFPVSLHSAPIVLPSSQSSLRTEFDALMLRRGISPDIVAEVDDMAMLRLLARESGFATLVPKVVVRDELRSGALQLLCRVAGVSEKFFAVTSKRRFQSKVVQEIITKKYRL